MNRKSLVSTAYLLWQMFLLLSQACRSPQTSCLPVTSAPVKAYFTCAEVMTLYVDGRYIKEHGNYALSLDVTIPRGSHVLAISCYGTRKRGIMGSLANGVLTDSSWKCSGSYRDDWHNVEFDDSSWPNAAEHARNDAGYWPLVSEISKKAKWIWTDTNSANHSTVYCRRIIVNTAAYKHRVYISQLSYRNHALSNHTFCSTRVNDVTSCFRRCLWREKCRSFNFQYSGTSKRNSLCEMNNSTEHESPQDLVHRQGFTYYDGSSLE